VRREGRERGGDRPRRGSPGGKNKTILDADLFVPESWDADRDRCRAADIPDDVGDRPKWELALDQVRRAGTNGVRFDGLRGKNPGVTAEQV